MTTKLDLTNLSSTALSQASLAPRITNIAYPNSGTTVSTSGSETVVITGTRFNSGIVVRIGTTIVSQVTRDSSTQLTIVTPANKPGKASLTVTNTDGNSSKFYDGIQYTEAPVWVTAPGSLGTYYEGNTCNISLNTQDSTAIVGYTLSSGSLPDGVSLNSNTGAITGTFGLISSDTTYNFTVDALYFGDIQSVSRSFSITVLADTITWTTPAYQNVLELALSVSSSTNIVATASSGQSITYSLQTALPTGLSFSSSTISGTPTVAGVNSVTIQATTSSGSVQSSNAFNLNILTPSQSLYNTAGTFTWTAPAGVTRVHAVCIGGGGSTGSVHCGGGAGGGLGWKNNIVVVPGTGYTVVVGAAGTKNAASQAASNGGDSYFISTSTVKGGGGLGTVNATGGTGGTYTGDGGGNGGNGGNYGAVGGNPYTGGGGGAGGYSGRGGQGQNGATENVSSVDQSPLVASGGAGGGGAGGLGDGNANGNFGGTAGGGGGVSVYGKGSTYGIDGSAGISYTGLASYGLGGGGGSKGTGGHGGQGAGLALCYGANGGTYGGGSSSGSNAGLSGAQGGTPGIGAVRIIWGPGRTFPSTNTGDV